MIVVSARIHAGNHKWSVTNRTRNPPLVRSEVALALHESARLGTAVDLPLGDMEDVVAQLYPEASEPLPPSPPLSDFLADTSEPASERLAHDGGKRAAPAWVRTGFRSV